MGAGITNGIIPSGGSAFRGVLVGLTSDENITVNVGKDIPWDLAVYDTETPKIWTSGAATKLIVPAGVTRVRLSFNILWKTTSAAAKRYLAQVLKNDADFPGAPLPTSDSTAFQTQSFGGVSSVLIVVPGDFFECSVQHNDGATEDVDKDNNTWFAMEIIT